MYIVNSVIAMFRFAVLSILFSGLGMIFLLVAAPLAGFVPNQLALLLAASVGILLAACIMYHRTYGHILVQWQSTAAPKWVKRAEALDQEFRRFNIQVQEVRRLDPAWNEALKVMRSVRTYFLPQQVEEMRRCVKRMPNLRNEFYYQLTPRARARAYVAWRANCDRLREVRRTIRFVDRRMATVARMAAIHSKTGREPDMQLLEEELQDLRAITSPYLPRGRARAPAIRS